MKVSNKLKSLGAMYTEKTKQPAFLNSLPTIPFCEAIARLIEMHKSNFITSQLEHSNALVKIYRDLED